MRIENLTEEEISKMTIPDLQTTRNKFLQVNDRWYSDPAWPDCPKSVFLEKYALLRKEMKKRKMIFAIKKIDRETFTHIAKQNKEEPEKDLRIKFIPIEKREKPEYIVSGIVYEPLEKDAEGDWATEEDIRLAAYSFMENGQVFKVNHEGGKRPFNVLETFLAPVDYESSGQKIKKGTWMLTARITDKDTWKGIESGNITGWSMAGGAVKIDQAL